MNPNNLGIPMEPIDKTDLDIIHHKFEELSLQLSMMESHLHDVSGLADKLYVGLILLVAQPALLLFLIP